MCFQLVERYSICRCLYRGHAIDPCVLYGRYDHLVQEKTVLVGYACPTHTEHPLSSSGSLDQLQNVSNAAEELAELFYTHETVGPLLHIGFEAETCEFGNYFTNLLLHFSTNLRQEISGWSGVELRACRLVRCRVPSVSCGVQVRLGYPLLAFFDDARKRRKHLEEELSKLGLLELDSNEDVQHIYPDLSSIRSLILAGPAFRRLARELREHRHQLTQPKDGHISPKSNEALPNETNSGNSAGTKTGLGDSSQGGWIARIFGGVLSVLRLPEPPLKHGKARIRWECRCGKMIYDDYEELIPGAAKALQGHLNKYSNRSPGNANEGRATELTGRGFSLLSTSWNNLVRRVGGSKESLPLSTGQIRTIQPQPNGRANRLLFLLTCLRLGTAPVLAQKNVCNVPSDQKFFYFLQSLRRNHRSRFWSIFAFDKMVRINFVHFELSPNSLVNILAEDCPPFDSGYTPIKDAFATFPPISSNIMVHLYENPSHADTSRLLIGRIPKKLDSELEICHIKRYGNGWGLELVDGLNWSKI